MTVDHCTLHDYGSGAGRRPHDGGVEVSATTVSGIVDNNDKKALRTALLLHPNLVALTYGLHNKHEPNGR